MSDKPASLHRPDRGVCYSHIRLDLRRDTKLFVTRNVAGHLHVTVGQSDATLILHPHAAARLIADLQAVMDGAEFSAK